VEIMEPRKDVEEIFDSHAHLCDEQFIDDIGDVIGRARENHVNKITLVTIDRKEFEAAINLKRKYPETILLCLGMHPCNADLNDIDAVVEDIRNCKEPLHGIGECGLDFTKKTLGEDPEAVKKEQYSVLLRQIELANELDLPLNIHSRQAGHYAIEFLKEHEAKKVVLHAFDGKSTYLRPALEAGYYFSIPPEVVRDPQKVKLVSKIPLDSLIIESDAPALGPVKGERNEPMYCRRSCEKIAEIKAISTEEVARVTTANFKALFGV